MDMPHRVEPGTPGTGGGAAAPTRRRGAALSVRAALIAVAATAAALAPIARVARDRQLRRMQRCRLDYCHEIRWRRAEARIQAGYMEQDRENMALAFHNASVHGRLAIGHLRRARAMARWPGSMAVPACCALSLGRRLVAWCPPSETTISRLARAWVRRMLGHILNAKYESQYSMRSLSGLNQVHDYLGWHGRMAEHHLRVAAHYERLVREGRDTGYGLPPDLESERLRLDSEEIRIFGFTAAASSGRGCRSPLHMRARGFSPEDMDGFFRYLEGRTAAPPVECPNR